MMSKLVRHVERLAAEREQRAARAVADELRNMVRNASVDIEGTNVIVRGRGLSRRWLDDPRLRFLGRGR